MLGRALVKDEITYISQVTSKGNQNLMIWGLNFMSLKVEGQSSDSY